MRRVRTLVFPEPAPATGVEQGRTAALYGMVLVAIFMILYYRVAGIIADFALLLNMLFIMAALAGFHAAAPTGEGVDEHGSLRRAATALGVRREIK